MTTVPSGRKRAAGQLVRLGDPDDFPTPSSSSISAGSACTLPPTAPRIDPAGARRAVHVEAHRDQPLGDLLDLRAGRALRHHHNHDALPTAAPPGARLPWRIAVRRPRLSASARSARPDGEIGPVCAASTTLTSALPTTAASAQPPTCRTCSGRDRPKPTATGSVVRDLTRATSAGASSGERLARAGDAEPRDHVQEARGRAPPPRRSGGRSSSGSAGRSGRGRPRPATSLNAPASSIGRSRASTPSTPAAAARVAEPSLPHRQQRVGVGEQHDRRPNRRAGRRSTRSSVDGQRAARGRARSARALDDRAVGQRIGERHADLDDVGAGAVERAQDVADRSRSGSPAVTYVTRPVSRRSRAGPVERRRQCATWRSLRSRPALATVCTSLSPRPERLTRMPRPAPSLGGQPARRRPPRAPTPARAGCPRAGRAR